MNTYKHKYIRDYETTTYIFFNYFLNEKIQKEYNP